jgi:N-acetylglucosaminyldiphosphoundecaprenol N-acetyl-beta-D-mannosaminyltransferase
MESDKVKILNININNDRLEDILLKASQMVDSSSKFYICTVNAYQAVKASEDKTFLKVLNDAGIVVADGMPLVWYSRLLKKPVPERISGYDFFYGFSKFASKKNYSYFFFGGKSDAVLSKIKHRLKKEFSNIAVKGSICPPIMDSFPDEYDDYVVSTINKCRPDILWVGISAPKQEKWIYKNIDRLNIKMAFGIGAAFNFYANTVRRAPIWMRRIGLEWLYRIYREPKRLFKKYMVNNTKFIILVFKDSFRRIFFRSSRF